MFDTTYMLKKCVRCTLPYYFTSLLLKLFVNAKIGFERNFKSFSFIAALETQKVDTIL